jgi:hypothetical protein
MAWPLVLHLIEAIIITVTLVATQNREICILQPICRIL